MESASKCQLCNLKEAKYVCPRCNIPYCSLPCYQSEVHSQCSESFYKDCVLEEIKSGDVDPQSQSKMAEILQRVQHIDRQFENDVQDSDDEDSEEELATRLKGVDLDDADSVWEKLTPDERRQFEELLNSGDVSEVVPPWQPWWLYREEKKLVTDTESSEDSPTFPVNVPKLLESIKPFSKLSKVAPSPFVRWNVINVLGAFSVTARIYNGDYIGSPQEAARTLTSLSSNLSVNQIFDGPEVAVSAVNLAAISNDCMLSGLNEGQLKEDVEKLVEGPSESQQNLYVLASLSEIYRLLLASKKRIKENNSSKGKGEFTKRFPDVTNSSQKLITVSEVSKMLKKIEFYLSWAVEYF